MGWIISKRAKPIFFKITSKQSIYNDKPYDVKFCFGVDLLNMMVSAVRGVNDSNYSYKKIDSCSLPLRWSLSILVLLDSWLGLGKVRFQFFGGIEKELRRPSKIALSMAIANLNKSKS